MTDATREQIKSDASAYSKDSTALDPSFVKKHHFEAGATHQHPISYEAGRKAERNNVIDEALKIVRVTAITWVKDERDFEIIRTIKEKLEALKTDKA